MATMKDDADKSPPADGGSRWRRTVFWLLLPCWLGALYGFVSWPILITLSIAGPLLFRWGASLAVSAVPHIVHGIAYFFVFVVGLLLLAGSAATLAPGMPGSWLATTASGLSLLDQRSRRVELALRGGSGGLSVTLSSSDPAVGLLEVTAGSASSVTVQIPEGQTVSGNTVATGGAAFVPQNLAGNNTTTVSATFAGSDPTYALASLGITVNVTTPTITITNQTGFSNRIGRELQDRYP